MSILATGFLGLEDDVIVGALIVGAFLFAGFAVWWTARHGPG